MPTERELQTWQGFLTTATLLTRRIEQRLREAAGLSHQQYAVLTRLASADGGQRMTELADAALTSKSGLSYQITQLEKAGLVTRSACPSDDRGVVACLTDEGRTRLSAATEAHADLIRTTFAAGLSPEQFTALSEGVDALRAHLG